MSARLEAATHQFQTSILVSEWFYNELSASARRYCRMVDRICVVGSKIPMEIWTVDVFNYDIDNFLEPIVGENGVQKLADWGTHEHFVKMQRKSGIDGWLDGRIDGLLDGWLEGRADGCSLGLDQGCILGNALGCIDGEMLGCVEGSIDGREEGCIDGENVG